MSSKTITSFAPGMRVNVNDHGTERQIVIATIDRVDLVENTEENGSKRHAWSIEVTDRLGDRWWFTEEDSEKINVVDGGPGLPTSFSKALLDDF